MWMQTQSEGGGGAPSGAEAISTGAPAPGVAGAADPADEITSTVAATFDSFGDRLSAFIENPTLSNAIETFGPMLLQIGQAIVALVVLVVVVMLVSRWVSRLTRAGLDRVGLEETVASFLGKIAKYAVWIIAIPIAFEILGVRTTSLAAVIGAAGLAIGLAMQGSLSNIAAGVMLLLLRPIKLGDWVELDDEFGEVIEIGIFYTHVRTFERKTVILPNSEVLSNKIENFTDTELRRIDVPVGVAYDTDLHEAMRVLSDAAQGVESRADEEEPSVILTDFGDSSINYEVRVFCESREYLSVRTSTILAIKDALDGAGIEIPFPQRDINFRNAARVRSESGSDEQGDDRAA